MSKLPNIVISGLELSDLFFNSELVNYNRACENETDIEKGLFLDAQEFLKNYPSLGLNVSSKMLVTDFLNRL